jgi:aspartate-semialdehyde dehydrogenase
MAGAGLRIAVVGATGALGTEVLLALDASPLPVRELVPLATDRSLGSEVEFQGGSYAIETEAALLRRSDLVFLCAPVAASLEWVEAALRVEVPIVDLSGALAERAEVPLAGGAPLASEALHGPAIAVPAGPALAWIRVLAPLHQALGVRRVVGTALVPAVGSGRLGIDALQAETLALLGQEEAPDSPLDHPLAFDLVPWAGPIDAAGDAAGERALAAVVGRALGGAARVAATCVRVPTFCGDAASLAIETEEPADPATAAELLRKAPDLELGDDAVPPTARVAAGAEAVLVGRLRRDPSRDGALLLWLAADSTRLAAVEAVRLATARFAS